MSIDSLHKSIQGAMPPSAWSRGVSLARDRTVHLDRENPKEIKLRVKIPGRSVCPSVNLWLEDEEWHCDCGDRQDPCAHVAAGVVAVKNGFVVAPSVDLATSAPQRTRIPPKLKYSFRRHEGVLLFNRVLQTGTTTENLMEPLVAFIGGIQSGRISKVAPSATQLDFAIDSALGCPPRSLLSAQDLAKLLPVLRDLSEEIEVDGVKVKISSRTISPRVVIEDATGPGGKAPGFSIRWKEERDGGERFRNGVVLWNGELALAPPAPPVLPAKGAWLPMNQGHLLAEEWIPLFEEKGVRIEVLSSKLPPVRERLSLAPRVSLWVEPGAEGDCTLVARLVYGDPPLAWVDGKDLTLAEGAPLITRDLVKEKEWIRRLQQELHLQPDKIVRMSSEEAGEFLENARGWEIEGGGRSRFERKGALGSRFDVLSEKDDFELEFSLTGGAGRADPKQVLRAWRAGRTLVPLIEGGFGELPRGWLEKYGDRIEALLLAKEANGKLPAFALPLLGELAEEAHLPPPESVKKIRDALLGFDGIPAAKLPKGLKADLRSYQKSGVDWLAYLKKLGAGALLADDMGLGKTLQALCVLEKRSLIVVPTSVLQAWVDQVERFRPSLSVQVYSGTKRELDPDADLVITSYGILRIDQDLLVSEDWECAVLDEAQTIKNPDSQAARAAYRIRARFKIALTGTPIENRLEDLWSQFQYLSPGLLGTRDAFQKRVGQDGTESLRARIRPFILRRLKKEVAPELPPRTEVTLRCELSVEEREIYQAILGGARKEIISSLKQGGNVLAALELLLRLRQASSHPALVPGQARFFGADRASAKIELLLERLKTSIEQGHRALVFSQWTSFLDLLEPHLKTADISWNRLDGSTKDRAGVVNAFQDPKGPEIMLLSLKAGGVGLTLTAADHVYLLDPWWNPAVEEQAADRAHRIGQENAVLIHRIVAEGTVEDRILRLQDKKRELALSALGEGNGGTSPSITRADLLALLEDLK